MSPRGEAVAASFDPSPPAGAELRRSAMAAELAEQPAVLRRLAARAPEDVARVADLVRTAPAGVAFLARGSSSNAATFGAAAVALLAGLPAGAVPMGVLSRYGVEVDYRSHLVVAVSQSGETPDVVRVAKLLRGQGARTIAITNDPGSSLAELAELTLAIDAGEERAVPATKTVTGAMLLGVVLAAALGELRGHTTPLAPGVALGELGRLGDLVSCASTDRGAVSALADRLRSAGRVVVLAQGLCEAAGLEVALKIAETALVPTEAYSISDLLHGPVATLGAATEVLLVDGDDAVARDVRDVRTLLVERGAAPLVLPTNAGPGASGPIPTLLAPFLAVVRGQQLALAAARGLDPDRPRGLDKVTMTT
jgi:glucosamine--fructose-6-phosphate aminotransferase (isomerizing)